MTATLSTRVEAQISGEIRGQIAVGNHIIQNNVDHGGIVYVAAPGENPIPRLRPLPISLPGRRPPSPLGREREIDSALASVAEASSLEFVGPSGIGKTTLLKYVAAVAPSESIPHGVVYHRAHEEPASDTLEHVFEAFYETSVPFKPTPAQIQHAVRDIEALIVLDDVTAGREGVDLLLDALPSAAFLLASSERALWASGRSVLLRGLPDAAARSLLERELGRAITPAEGPIVTALLRATHGEPLKVVQLAALIREAGFDLGELARDTDAEDESAAAQLRLRLLESLTDDQRRVWEVLDMLDGATLPADQLAEIAEVDDVEPVLRSLLAFGLIQAHSPRYSITAPSSGLPHSRVVGQPSGWASKARAYLIGWTEANRDRPEVVLAETEAVLAVLRRAAREGALDDLMRLARAVEAPFILGRRWGVWGEILDHELTAARRLGDRAAEGWSLHQLGTRALCLGDNVTARRALSDALRIRASLGNMAAAAATRHNLGLLPGASEPSEPPPRDTPPAAPLLGLPLILLLGVIAGVVVFAGAVVILATRPDPVFVVSVPVPGLTVAPSTVDFGSQRTETTSTARSVLVTNDGIEEIALGRLDVTGDDAPAFGVDQDGCGGLRLARGESCTVSVVFAPSATGPQSATLVIGAAEGGQHTVALVGRGDDGLPPPGPLTWEPSPVDFGGQELNGSPVVRTVILRNAGNAAVDVARVTVSGPAARDFSIGGGCRGRLEEGQSCPLDVRFVPRLAGRRDARLIATAGNPAQTAVAHLSGTGDMPCSLDPIGDQTAVSGSFLAVPVQARAEAGRFPTEVTASGFAEKRDPWVPGRWSLEGVVHGDPGVRQITVTASGNGCFDSEPFNLTVVPSNGPAHCGVSVQWREPVADLTLGPPEIQATVTGAPGTQCELTHARVIVELRDIVTRAIVDRRSCISTQMTSSDRRCEFRSNGTVTVPFAPGELPTGIYLATACVDPEGRHFHMVSPDPVAVVVNIDMASAVVNALSGPLGSGGLGRCHERR